jgi:hypothetical protein
MTGFDLFIGIDWSGAQGEYHKGIQVAEAEHGTAAPRLIPPPHPKGWSREMVLTHLRQRRDQGRRVLAGIDFAFCHPFDATGGGYYPHSGLDLRDALTLWQTIEAANNDQPHLYGGKIWGDPTLRHYYNAPQRKDGSGGKGNLFQSRRRLTETIAAQQGRSPSPTFNCVGPAGVGTGSLAGMRLLNALKDDAVIWPITDPNQAAAWQSQASVLEVVEIFPALYFAMASVKDKVKAAEPMAALNQALAYFNADPAMSIAHHLPDHDDLDAIISAAALRDLHQGDVVFHLDTAIQIQAQREGWIFGVNSPKTKP